MPDVFLRPVPSDANATDVRLRNPEAADAGGALAVGLAVEADAALARPLQKRLAVGLAAEGESAFALRLVKRLAAGVAVEADSALSRSLAKHIAPGRADSSEASLGRPMRKIVQPGVAQEVDAALARTLIRAISPGIAVETDEALAPKLRKEIEVGVAVEVDEAVPRPLTTDQPEPVAFVPTGAYALPRPRRLHEELEVRARILLTVGIAVQRDQALAPAFGVDPISADDAELETLLIAGVL